MVAFLLLFLKKERNESRGERELLMKVRWKGKESCIQIASVQARWMHVRDYAESAVRRCFLVQLLWTHMQVEASFTLFEMLK